MRRGEWGSQGTEVIGKGGPVMYDEYEQLRKLEELEDLVKLMMREVEARKIKELERIADCLEELVRGKGTLTVDLKR